MQLAADFLSRVCAHAPTELLKMPLAFAAAGLLVEFRHTLQLGDPHPKCF
jgi:hypothetical protein